MKVKESILQYFQPSLSYHLSSIPLFWLLLSGSLRQVLLYRRLGTTPRISLERHLIVYMVHGWLDSEEGFEAPSVPSKFHLQLSLSER